MADDDVGEEDSEQDVGEQNVRERDVRERRRSPRRTRAAPPRRRSPNGLSVARAARLAAQQVAELTGRVPEGVVSVERTDGGWRISIEVVESHRIPDSADILATYEAELDRDGELAGYHRVRRYPRGRTQEDRG